MTDRARQAYDFEFDLSDLPANVPGNDIVGTVRLWGNNYIGDSGLAERWCKGFRKFHSGADCELILPTAAVACSIAVFRACGCLHEP